MVKSGWFCADKDGRRLFLQLEENLRIDAQCCVKLYNEEQWIRMNVVEESKQGIKLTAKGTKVIVHFHREGRIQVDADGSNVQELRILLTSKALTNCFVQGYQTWNLSHGAKIGVDCRKKSLASKLGMSGMFQDTDNPVWKMNNKGIESHGLLLLEHKDLSGFFLLGGTSAKKAVTSFWTFKRGDGNTIVECILDWGVPGARNGAMENFIVIQGESSQDLLESYAAHCKSSADDNSVDSQLRMESPLRELGRAPLGWGSWYEFYEHVTAKDVTEVLQALKKDQALKDCVDVFQLDDGYQLNTGDWLETQTKFGEKDLSKVAENIVSDGFTPGLWVAPFLASRTSNVYKDHPDWFLKKVSNPKKYVVGHYNPAWKRGSFASAMMYVLDLSNPEVLDHIETTFRQLAKHWRFFKVDFLAAGMREAIRLNGNKMTRVEAYIAGVKAIRRGIGPDCFLLGCGAPLLPSMQSNCFDSMRVSCDTAERWAEPRLLKAVVSDWAIPCCSKALWGNMTRWFMQNDFWRFNDPDCLVLRRKGNSMTEAQVKTQVTILGMTGGLLLFTDNMATLEEDRKELAFRVLPATPLRGKPLGSLSTAKEAPSTFILNDLEDTSQSGVVALTNWDGKSNSIAAPRDGFDFWKQVRVKKGETLRLEKYETCALQFAEENCPVIGTTLHLTALADKRITVEFTSSSCLISGQGNLVLRKGILVFRCSSKGLAIVNQSNLLILREPFDLEGDETCAVEVQIERPSWTLEIALKTPSI